MMYPSVPEGYRRLDAHEVWTNGSDLIVLGMPPRADDEENGHNCDEMGCAQCHVLARAWAPRLGFDFAALRGEEASDG